MRIAIIAEIPSHPKKQFTIRFFSGILKLRKTFSENNFLTYLTII